MELLRDKKGDVRHPGGIEPSMHQGMQLATCSVLHSDASGAGASTWSEVRVWLGVSTPWCDVGVHGCMCRALQKELAGSVAGERGAVILPVLLTQTARSRWVRRLVGCAYAYAANRRCMVNIWVQEGVYAHSQALGTNTWQHDVAMLGLQGSS